MKSVQRKIIKCIYQPSYMFFQLSCGHFKMIKDWNFGRAPKTTICHICSRESNGVKR